MSPEIASSETSEVFIRSERGKTSEVLWKAYVSGDSFVGNLGGLHQIRRNI